MRAILFLLLVIGALIPVDNGRAQDQWQFDTEVGGIEWHDEAILIWTFDAIYLYDSESYVLLDELVMPGRLSSVQWNAPYLLLTFEEDFHVEIWNTDAEVLYSSPNVVSWGDDRVVTRLDDRLVVWDFIAGAEIAEFPADDAMIFSPDCRHALHLTDAVHLWNVDTMQSTEVSTIPGYAADWKADGSQFIITGLDGTATLYDAISLEPQWEVEFELPAGGTISVQWTPDESLVWGQLGRTTISVWDPSSGELLTHLDTGQFIGDVQWHEDKLLVSFAAMEDQLQIWDARNDDQLLELDMSIDYLGAFWSANGRYLAARTFDAGISILEAASGVELWSYAVAGLPILAWHPTEPKLLAADGSTVVRYDMTALPIVLYADPAHELGCLGCHQVDGLAAPLAGIVGETRTLPDGATATVDAIYLQGLLTEPDRYIPSGSMPGLPAHQQLTATMTTEQIESLVNYILELSK